MVVYHSELAVLRCSSGTIVTCSVFPKTQAIICLEVLCARATFVVYLAHLETPIQSTAAYFRAHMRNSIFFLTIKCSYNIECMLVPLMAKVVSISR